VGFGVESWNLGVLAKWAKTCAGLWLASALGAVAQGTFQNLDFESPNADNLTNDFVAFSDAFPGWTGWLNGTNQTSLAGYNIVSVGTALATIITPTAPYGFGSYAIDGNYTATIVAGEFGPLVGIVSTAIAQTGAIPPSARSLRFSASGLVQYLSVSFNGVNVPFSPVGTGPNYGLFAADVSQFAGQSGELRFTEQAVPIEPLVVLDDILFSPTAVPEPTSEVCRATYFLSF
jgi:hypothetical protein